MIVWSRLSLRNFLKPSRSQLWNPNSTIIHKNYRHISFLHIFWWPISWKPTQKSSVVARSKQLIDYIISTQRLDQRSSKLWKCRPSKRSHFAAWVRRRLIMNYARISCQPVWSKGVTAQPPADCESSFNRRHHADKIGDKFLWRTFQRLPGLECAFPSWQLHVSAISSVSAC